MAGVESSPKAKVLTFYAIAWLMVLVVGATGLMALRQWGWSRIEEEHARTEFAQTREAFDRGDVIQAQKTLVRLLEARPERLARALAVFDTDILGMPAAAATVSRSPERQHLSSMERLRQSFILEGFDDALKQLDTMPPKGKNDRAALLWHARLLLRAGNFGDADERFDRYWSGYPDERRETIDQLTPGDEELKQRGASAADQLFALGLWDEATQVAKDALAAGAEDPSLGFYTANMAERREGRVVAIAKYEQVLEALPNHDLALRRIQVLAQQDW